MGADCREFGDAGVEELKYIERLMSVDKVRQVTSETYASPSSDSSLLAFLLREPLGPPLEEIFCATPRLLDEVLLPCGGPGEEAGEGAL